MYLIITILAIVAAVVLGAIVLIQNPKGGGLSGSFGGVGQQLLGARHSTDIVEKLTWGFAAALLVFCLSTAFFIDKNAVTKTQLPKSEIEQQQMNNPVVPQGGGGLGAPQQQQPAGQQPAGAPAN